MAWLNPYKYRVPITVTNSSGGTLTNYQVHLTLNTSSLISGGKLQASGNDLAASDSDGFTQINLWFDPDTLNTTTTDVWVKIPSLSTGTYTIYVYYGYASASKQSTISGTFIYGDDFSTNTAGNYTTSGGSVSVSGGVMTLNGVSQSNTVASPTTQTNPSSYIVEAKISIVSAAGAGDNMGGLLGFKSTLTGGDGYVAQFGNIASANKVDIEKYTQAHLVGTGITYSNGTYYPVKGTFVSANITALFNNATSANSTDATYTSGMYGIRSGNATIGVKYFRVRAYTATEPTTSNGSEQVYIGGGLLLMGVGA